MRIHRIILGLTVLIMSLIIIYNEPDCGIIFTILAYSAGWDIVGQVLSPIRKEVSKRADAFEQSKNAEEL